MDRFDPFENWNCFVQGLTIFSHWVFDGFDADTVQGDKRDSTRFLLDKDFKDFTRRLVCVDNYME
jgi:hypothetical protein